MTEELWETGLREAMAGTATAATIVAPPTDVILRKGRTSLRLRNGLAGSGALGMLAAAVIVGTTVGAGSADGPAAAGPQSRSASASSTAPLRQALDAVVIVGSAAAKNKVVIYEDYRCPVCKDVNAGIDETLTRDAASGTVQIEYRPTNLIDSNHGTPKGGSVAAGNAVQCAAEQGDFAPYRAAVYAHQPPNAAGAPDTFNSPEELIAIAREVPGLATKTFTKCVEDEPYAAAIMRNYSTAINVMHCGGMPCVIVDGQQWMGPVGAGGDAGNSLDIWLSQKIAAQK